MKNRKQLLLIVFVMLGCILTGCGNAGNAGNTEEVGGDGEVGETGEAQPAEKDTLENDIAFSFGDITNLEFWFGSGAGAWCTVLTVHEDGSFEGEYHDAEGKTLYLCNFTGNFTEPVKVDEYTYSVKLEQIQLAEEPGTEEWKDEIYYKYSEPYGLEDAEELLFYLPGVPVKELPEAYRECMGGYGDTIDTLLPFYGLFNVNGGEGYSSHEKARIDDELAVIQQEAAVLENKLQTEELSQAEMTETASALYQIWDKALNVVWSQLKDKLEPAAMDALTGEELEWIANKENEILKAGAEFEGGSMQSMVAYSKGAELTKARVYELAEYLR